MVEAKTSPGPWTWGPDKMDGMNTLLDAEGNDVAFARSYDDEIVVKNPDDAALIASAPTLAAQLAEAVGLLRELHANMNHQTGPGCCPSGRFLTRVDGAKVSP